MILGNPNVGQLNVSSSVKELTEQPLYIGPNGKIF